MTITHFKHLTEQALPTQALTHHWPIRLDHCFKRICLDHAFGGVWHHHIPRPAKRHLTGDPLARAIACAEQILAQGLPVLTERNQASLRYRGKLPKELFLGRSAPRQPLPRACIQASRHPSPTGELRKDTPP